MIEGRLPTVPEYYKDFIDENVDLTESPKQCCPLHEEDTPSFSYDIRTGKCSCFGKCHAYGMDVIELHRRRARLKTKEESRIHLCKLYKTNIAFAISTEAEEHPVNMEKVEDSITLYKACLVAEGNIDRLLELDYEMSISPYERLRIQKLLDKWYEEN